MAGVDKMFRVIVAGGIALSASAPGLVVGCGGSASTPAAHDGGGSDAFPVEGPVARDASGNDAFPQETAQALDGFPQEGPDVHVADAGLDGFPQEGPVAVDASSGGDGGFDGFPMETASP